MTLLSETIQIPIAPITIKRGSLGIIRVGPTDIEIPAEDVTITTVTLTVNFAEEVKAIVTAEIAKLKAEIAAREKLAVAAPTELLEWREVKSVHASEEKRSS